MVLSLFEIVYQSPVFYPQEDPLGATRALRQNLNDFSTTIPILDIKVSLDRAQQYKNSD